MNLDDKCLLVLKPAERFQEWLQTIVQATQEAVPAQEKIDIALEDLQVDASCYLLPRLPAAQAAEFVQAHCETLFEKELSLWCQFREAWPSLDFSTFYSFFHFQFYYDWMDYNKQLNPNMNNIDSLIFVVKPQELFVDFLRELMIKHYAVPESEVDKKLDLRLIQNASSVVVSDVNDLNDAEYFLDRHADEIFTHQLLLWGGPESQDLWPRDINMKGLKETFNIEIHRHNYLMLT